MSREFPPQCLNPSFAIAEVDPAELAVQMCEASYGLTRPPGTTGRQALDAMDAECRAGWLRAAEAALTFIQERLAAAQRPN